MTTNPHLWWELTRATGITAWAMSGLSVLMGLLLSTRAVRHHPTPAWQTDLHRLHGGLTVAFVGAHLLALVADSYVRFGAAELFVPFASSWRPGAVAWGIVALYLLLAVEATSLLRGRISRRAWRAVHSSSVVVYSTATLHAVTAGTDRSNVVFGWAMVLLTVVNVTLLVARVLLTRVPRSMPARPADAVTRRSAA